MGLVAQLPGGGEDQEEGFTGGGGGAELEEALEDGDDEGQALAAARLGLHGQVVVTHHQGDRGFLDWHHTGEMHFVQAIDDRWVEGVVQILPTFVQQHKL